MASTEAVDGILHYFHVIMPSQEIHILNKIHF